MSVERKFNPSKFRTLLDRKLQEKGYKSVRDFAMRNSIHRNALARTATGVTRPSLDSLNHWCDVLECTPQERNEIIASVYLDELEEPSPNSTIWAA